MSEYKTDTGNVIDVVDEGQDSTPHTGASRHWFFSDVADGSDQLTFEKFEKLTMVGIMDERAIVYHGEY